MCVDHYVVLFRSDATCDKSALVQLTAKRGAKQ